MTNLYIRICENGHVAKGYKRLGKDDECQICGAKLYDSCPHCSQPIKVWHHYGAVPKNQFKKADEYVKRDTCGYCGKELPWADRAHKLF